MRRTFCAAIVTVAALAGACAAVAGDERPEKLEQGKLAPKITVGQWKNSKPIDLDDLKGKVVVLDFWGVW